MRLATQILAPVVVLVVGPALLIGWVFDRGQIGAHPIQTMAVGLAVAAAAFLFYLLHVTVSSSVKALTRAIAKISEKDYDTPVVSSVKCREMLAIFGALEDLRRRLKARAEELLAALDAEKRAAAARKAAGDEESRGYVEAHNFFMTTFIRSLDVMSTGDLSHRLTQPFSVDYEKLRHSYNASLDRLGKTFREIVEHIHNVSSRTQEIHVAADSLSNRTCQQAASLEETSAALKQITSTVKKTAEGAQHASDVVSEARHDAEKSSEVVDQAIEAMGRIEKSSQEIGQIIGVIDEIAFQTNLLALNAGVEAARAGEAGKGFAVVASEVRALAQRSAEAAREIKTLISASTTHVRSGVKLVAETGAALNRIVGQVSEANQAVAEIAQGAREQAIGLQEINTAISQMDQFTQHNAAMVEETNAASQDLNGALDDIGAIIAQVKFESADAGKGANAKALPAAAKKPSSSPRSATTRGVASSSRQTAAALKENFETDDQSWAEF